MTPARPLAGLLAAVLAGVVCLAPTSAYAEETSPAGVVPLPGESIEGSPDQDGATPVSAGLWRDEVGPYVDTTDPAETGDPKGAEAVRWYDYERVTDESTLLVSVISPGADPDVADGIELQVLTPSGDSCTSGASSTRTDDDRQLLAAQLWVGVQEAAATGDETYDCLNQNRLLIAVSRGSSGESGSAPYTLRVVEESPLEGDAELADPVEVGEPEAPDVDAERQDLDGGASFEDAPEVTGGRYRGSTSSDRTVLYRVPDVGWGQTVRAALSADRVDLGGGGYSGPEISLQVLTPMLTPFGTSGADEQLLSPTESSQLVASAGPVRYLNRLADIGSDQGPYAPGDHYVLVTVSPPDDGGQALDVGYTLEVEVAGEAEDAPAFVESDAYLVAEGDEQPVITAVGAGGLVGTLLTVLRWGGVVLLVVAGLVALVAGLRTLRAPRPRAA